MYSRLAIGVFLSASAWGQMFELGSVPRAEDSPLTAASNMTFYNSPRGPELTPPPAPPSTVSVEELQHPLSRKATAMLRKARRLAETGQHGKAIEQLKLAMTERSAVPWAESMLGVEYLKTNQVPEAIGELEQAVKVLSRNVPDRSNLGYALFLTGDLDRAEAEVREALDLDHNNDKTRKVLNQILAARQSKTNPRP